MRINTNVSALNTYRNLTNTENAVNSSMQKLSSGFRINRAADDAAGLAIANKLRDTSRALQAANRNAQQASSMLQTADGAGQSIASILDRMKELASQAASDNIGDQRGKLNNEFKALNDEIQRIVDTTQYQGTKLLNGSGAGTVSVGTDSTVYASGADIAKITASSSAYADTTSGTDYTLDADTTSGVITLSWTDAGGTSQTEKVLAEDGAQTLTFAEAGITIETATTFNVGTSAGVWDSKKISLDATPGSGSGLTILVGATGQQTGADKLDIKLAQIAKIGSFDLTSLSGAQTAMDSVDTLLDTVNDFIGDVGALQSRLDFTMQNLAVSIQNTAASESTIRDVDMAQEMTNFSKNQILQQAGTAMLAQANQLGQGVLTLLRG
jgi:flagellin